MFWWYVDSKHILRLTIRDPEVISFNQLNFQVPEKEATSKDLTIADFLVARLGNRRAATSYEDGKNYVEIIDDKVYYKFNLLPHSMVPRKWH